MEGIMERWTIMSIQDLNEKVAISDFLAMALSSGLEI